MPTQSFTLGRDTLIQVISPVGELNLNVTEFQSQQRTHQVVSRPLGRPTQIFDVPDMWSGSFQIDRNSPNIENAIAQIESDYWAGRDLQTWTMYAYIEEIDGSTSTYEYVGVTMRLSNAGTYKNDDAIKQTVEFSASLRRRV